MGFTNRWINWINACIESPTFSIMLNGSPAVFSPSNRGIRLGDLLSLYMFMMVMEFWSIIMELSMHSGKINPIKRGKLEVSHLLFADDNLFFCKGDEKSAKCLTELLEQFRLNTGLVINKNKSKAFFSKGCGDHGYIGHSSWEFSHQIPWASTINHIPKNREFLSFA